LYRGLGKKTVIQFQGSEARLDSVEAARNPFYPMPTRSKEKANRARLERWSDITRGVTIAFDHSFEAALHQYFDRIHVIRQCVDTEVLTPVYPSEETTVPTVVHAPSSPRLKGSEHLRKAVERLRGRVRFRYEEITTTSHREVIDKLREADLVVDQLLLGSHGVIAAEAMSLGKPVICYILPELIETYPNEFPVISADPSTVEAVLEQWLTDGRARSDAGRASRAYALKTHDVRSVAARALSVYEELP